MYASHWGLSESPFRSTRGAKYFYSSPTHEEALARLHFLVDHGRRFGLLRGDRGCGKTLLLEVFANQLRDQGDTAVTVNLKGLDSMQCLWLIAEELGAKPRERDALHIVWRKVANRLRENRYQKLPTVLLLDDAGSATDPVLCDIHRLISLEPTVEGYMTILCALRTEETHAIGPRLLDLCELRIDVSRWDAGDVTQFVRSTIAQAGGEASIFDELAESRLYELSRGVPRKVSQLVDRSLLTAAEHKRSVIDERTIESAFEALSVL